MISNSTWSKHHVQKKDRQILIKRDKRCVYCHDEFGSGGRKDSVEHIDNDTWKKNPAVLEDLAICCMSCNGSKGTLKLLDWFETPYCKINNINKETVAQVIKDWIKQFVK
ncbi:MAG: HNH endonuclease [Candidatus Aenigmatarchaeota archaeon]